MKSLKFLFIYLTLSLAGFSALQAQNQIIALTKGQEIFTDARNPNTNERFTTTISSQNEAFRFSYNFTDKKWVISDNAGNEKTVAFYTSSEPNLHLVISEGLVIGNDENLNFILKYEVPVGPNGKSFKVIPIATGVDKLELTNQGGLVAKNAAGAVIWGPIFGN
jgi:hypothetical protein